MGRSRRIRNTVLYTQHRKLNCGSAARAAGKVLRPGLFVGVIWAAGICCAGLLSAETGGPTSVHVLVKDAETGQPISQARLTLEFHEAGDLKKLKRPKFHSYSAKTNPQGRYRFPDIPRGSVRLVVTAERHQTFSKWFEVDKENPLFEVRLKKPQPLL